MRKHRFACLTAMISVACWVPTISFGETLSNRHHVGPNITGMPDDCFHRPQSDYRAGSDRPLGPSPNVFGERRYGIESLTGDAWLRQRGLFEEGATGGAYLVPEYPVRPDCIDNTPLK